MKLEWTYKNIIQGLLKTKTILSAFFLGWLLLKAVGGTIGYAMRGSAPGFQWQAQEYELRKSYPQTRILKKNSKTDL